MGAAQSIFNVLSGKSTYLSRLLMFAHILPITFWHGCGIYTAQRIIIYIYIRWGSVIVYVGCLAVPVYYFINKHLMGKVNDDRTSLWLIV